MKKFFLTYLHSFKSSALNKPMALLLLFFAAVIAVVSCGWATRTLISGIEGEIFQTVETYKSDNSEVAAAYDLDKAAETIFKLREAGLFGYDSAA